MRLIVKNFGPLKDIDIELSKINLFIGENGSGKSVLAKLITILFTLKITLNIDEFKKDLEKFNINYLNNLSYIKLEHKLGNILINNLELSNSIINSSADYFFINFDKKEETDNEKFSDKYFEYIKNIDLVNLEKKKNFNNLDIENIYKSLIENIDKIKKNIEKFKEFFIIHNANYIPAERNFISLLNKSLASIISSDIPLPKFLLKFISDFEKATNDIKELEALGVKYINSDGLDRHKVYFNDNEYLPLEQSSSGIQSAIPLYLTFKYFTKKHSTIVVEEPEQNLFPKAQKETVEFLIENIKDKDSNLFMMTHSPYILSAINILLYANKVGNISNEAKKEVNRIINQNRWIDSNSFNAYYIKDGKAESILSKSGLITDNAIDEYSQDIEEIFNEIFLINKKYKDNAKSK